MNLLFYILFFVLLSLSNAVPATLRSRPIEDDMILAPAQKKLLLGVAPRNANSWKKYYWPKATVVYSIGKGFPESELPLVNEAMKSISSKTCIKFRRTTDAKEPQVVIQRTRRGCSTVIGYWAEISEMQLNKECMKLSTIQHQLLHVLSFLHMHAHPQRDKYIKVTLYNVKDGFASQFDIVPTAVDFGTGYDYYSIMQYPSNAYSSNGKPTMLPLDKNVKLGGTVLSDKDIIKIKKMYC